MFGIKKKNQGNTLKNTPPPEKSEKKKKATEPRKFSLRRLTDPLYDFIENDKNRYTLGLSLLLVSAFLTLSFASFFFTWEVDQDKIGNWSTTGIEVFHDDFTTEKEAQNLMGTIGARLSHFFIFNGIGITAFGIPFLLTILGLRWAFNIKILPLVKTTKSTFIIMIWSTLFLSALFQKSNLLNPGGALGHQVYTWLEFLAGPFGVGFILLFSAFLISRLTFNFRIESLLQKEVGEETDNENTIVGENSIATPLTNFKTVTPDLEEVKTVTPEPVLETRTVQEPIPEPEITTQNSVEVQPEIVSQLEIVTPPQKEETNEPPMELTIDQATEETAILEEKEVPEEVVLNVEPEVTIELSTDIPAPSAPIDPEEEIALEVEATPEKEILLTEDEINKKVEEFGEYDPTLDLGTYKFPTIDLLKQYDAAGGTKVDAETLEVNKNNIIETLRNYKIEIASIKATIGPTITLYEIVPAPGVRISKIKNLEDDIALSLAALGIRIIAPIPGKGTIGIEVPNPKPDIVSMHTAISSKAFQEAKMELPLALGKTITNETYTIDLAKMPHLLMAGATGQGKSVGLNAILVSLLYKKHPSQLKLVLVDPKKVELTLFNKVVRHFLAKLPDSEEPIITDTQKVVNTLNSLCVEMDNRYEMLKDASCRNIIEYNAKFKKRKLNPEKGHKFLPYIVLVIDEFADLIMTAGKEVETPIARLAQLARAIGIHLIVATQRPSVNIITGTIKANFPCRIAFRVTSKIDSRTILDAGGADQLIGRGDMLIATGNDLVRIQCAFVDTPEVEAICEYIGEQRGYADAYLLPEYVDNNGEAGAGNEMDLDDRDALFEDAARVIVLHQQGSASLLQRKLKLGYNRAGRIVDQLEAAGIIGQFEGSKARQVLIPDDYSLEQLLNNLNNKNN